MKYEKDTKRPGQDSGSATTVSSVAPDDGPDSSSPYTEEPAALIVVNDTDTFDQAMKKYDLTLRNQAGRFEHPVTAEIYLKKGDLFRRNKRRDEAD